jgi:hypothetical protein
MRTDLRNVTLWPSFNVVDVDGGRVTATTVAFDVGATVERTLVDVERAGLGWTPREVVDELAMAGPRVEMNVGVYEVDGRALRVRRSVVGVDGYEEIVEGGFVTELVGGRTLGRRCDVRRRCGSARRRRLRCGTRSARRGEKSRQSRARMRRRWSRWRW